MHARKRLPISASHGMNESYYIDSLLFGNGNINENNIVPCYEPTPAEVAAIANSNKSFYAIGVSSDVSRMEQLMEDAGQPAGNAFVCTDEEAMQEAFESITQSIKSALGFGDVGIIDGITDLTHAEMKIMQTVDPDSFTYYRYGGDGNKYGADYAHRAEWTTVTTDGCGLADYDEASGAVTWNMGDRFQLEDGVTYVVTFRVWPSQEAYDLIADLNNGVKVYAEGHDNSIAAAERVQVVELVAPTATTQGSYALKTNTDELNATYKRTSKTGETVTVVSTDPIDAVYADGVLEDMPLESMKLTVKKEFEDDLTAGVDRETEVTLVLKRRDAHQTPEAAFADYLVPQGGVLSPNIVLNEDNNWTYSLYVAPGFEVDGEVLEHGYDFTLTEPGIDYHYYLVEEIINPMVVNGEDAYYGDGHLIDDEETVQKYVDRSLTAINRVKSGIDVKKLLVDEDGNELTSDVEFTIKDKLLDQDGDPYTWQGGDSVDASGAYRKYDASGNRVVYKGHFADSSNIEFTLKSGEYVRFINVPGGCYFEFDEVTSTLPGGYEWKETAAVTQHLVSPGSTEYTTEGDVQPVVNGSKASLDGVTGNKQYVVTFTNTVIPVETPLTIKKIDQDGADLDGVVFELYIKGESLTKVTGLTGADPDGSFTIGSLAVTGQILPDTVYKLVEQSTPAGYLKMTDGVYFKVHDGVIQLTDEDGQQLVDQDDNPITSNEYAEVSTAGDMLTISVKNEPGTELPNAGGPGTRLIFLLGALLVAIGGARLVLARRRAIV